MIMQTAEPDWTHVLSFLNVTKNDKALATQYVDFVRAAMLGDSGKFVVYRPLDQDVPRINPGNDHDERAWLISHLVGGHGIFFRFYDSQEQQGCDGVLFGTLKDIRAADAARKRSMI